jgi:integrase
VKPKLNNTAIDSILAKGKPGRYSDGSGLYFVKTKTGTGCWVLMYRREGKLRELGLGSYTAVARVTLKQVRLNALQLRAKIGAGEDPLKEKRRNAPSASFKAMMEAKIASKMTEWGRTAAKNEKVWTSTLNNHASALMDVSVAKIDTDKVVAVLGKIWTTKVETADRVRERIAQVLDYAKAKKLREGDNPAAKDTIRDLLGAQQAKGTEQENHKAMDRAMIQPFWARLRKVEGLAARALEMVMLTGARSGEVRGMLWSEIDLDAALWTIPGSRMKAGKEHVVTLSTQAVALLRVMPRRVGTDVVFWNARGKAFDAVTLRRLLRDMGVSEAEASVHGFRSCFVSWVRDTGRNEALGQVAIAHAVGSKVDRAYQKGKALDLRFEMLQAWADFLDSPTVVPFVKAA